MQTLLYNISNSRNNFKQEAHGPHRSPEKTVQINIHIWYIITLIERRKKILTYVNLLFFHLNPHPRMLCAKISWNWLSCSGEQIFLISSLYFRYFCNNLPLEMGWVLHLNKLESPSPKDALCQVWLKLAQWF